MFQETWERDWREHEEFFSKKISVLQKYNTNFLLLIILKKKPPFRGRFYLIESILT